MHNLTQCICTGALQLCSWLWHMCQKELSIYTCSKSILYCTVGSLARITILQVQHSSECYLTSTNILPKLKCTLPFTQRHHICKYKSSRPVVYKNGVIKKPTVISDEEEIVACCSRFVGYFMMYQQFSLHSISISMNFINCLLHQSWMYLHLNTSFLSVTYSKIIRCHN